MFNEYSYELALCPHDGAQWLEEVSYTPATRWEPEDWDIDEKPCPVCKRWDTVYPPDSQFGALAQAALECARIVAYFVEYLGLPTCCTCGQPFYEGWTADGKPLCMACGEREADEYFRQEDLIDDYLRAHGGYVEAQQNLERLLNDYFDSHCGNFDAAVEDHLHFLRTTQGREVVRIEAIADLYYRYAFGVQAVECPQCNQLTINAWEDADVWNCRPCVRADAEFECRLDYGDGEGYNHK